MPLEPNKRIDELLKRFVKKRREEARADFELHPATRRTLQSEVTRVFPKGETETKHPFFSALWPRLALAGAFTAMLLVTVMVLNQPQKSKLGFELSQNAKDVSERAAPAQARRKMDDAVALSDASVDKKNVSKLEIPASSAAPLAKRLAAEKELASVSGSVGGTGGIPAETKSLKETDQLAWIKSRDDSPPARSEIVADSAKTFYSYAVTNTIDGLQTRAAARAVTSDIAHGSASVSFSADSTAQNRWRFVQQDLRAKYRQNLLSPAQPAVLQSFEVARVGNKIQLFDSDGSVYEGEILDAAAYKLGVEEAKQKKEQSSEFAFRVTGTNQQINRIVTFSGNFAVPNINQALAKTPVKTADDFQSGAFGRHSGVAGNGLIQGKVSIGGTNEFEIQATEVAK